MKGKAMKEKDNIDSSERLRISTRVSPSEYRLIKAVADGYGCHGVSDLLRELLFCAVRYSAGQLGHRRRKDTQDLSDEVERMFSELSSGEVREWPDDVRKRR